MPALKRTMAALVCTFFLLNSIAKMYSGVLIITPTRELAIQIFGVATDLFKHNPDLSLGIVLGGIFFVKICNSTTLNLSM